MMTEQYSRGFRDGQRGRAPLFRRVGESLVPALDAPLADDWGRAARESYIEGHDAGAWSEHG